MSIMYPLVNFLYFFFILSPSLSSLPPSSFSLSLSLLQLNTSHIGALGALLLEPINFSSNQSPTRSHGDHNSSYSQPLIRQDDQEEPGGGVANDGESICTFMFVIWPLVS